MLDDDDLEELQEDLFRSQEEREMSGTPDSWADLEGALSFLLYFFLSFLPSSRPPRSLSIPPTLSLTHSQ